MDTRHPIINRDRLIILAIFALAVVAAVIFQLLRDNGTPEISSTSSPLCRSQMTGGFRGFSIQLQNGRDNHPYEKYIEEIAHTGGDTVCLVISAFQENCSSTSIFVDIRRAPGDERLKKLIQRAHGHGLRVVLMPIVLLENPRVDEWRGTIAPPSWDDWWEDYRSYILHYADIADSAGADVFMVGSELISTEKQTDRWESLISEVRRVYKGLLSYSANWDHYWVPQWWDKLDIIGMTSYHDLAEQKAPTVEELVLAWKPIKQKILDWQANINRPILFTEVGWPNQATCAQFPWDYYRSTDDPDPQTQSNCFEAFFQTWTNEKSVIGFLIWEWRNHPSQQIGPEDTSYVPCGKPAMNVIKKYFSLPSVFPASSSVLPTKLGGKVGKGS